MGKVSLISLGCPKNLSDSEQLLKRLAARGIAFVPDPSDSDIILVNTCGFIDTAKRESVEEILRLAKLKEERPERRLLVFGCLAKRYGNELRKEIPEVDALWGIGEEEKIVDYCEGLLGCAAPLDISARRLSNTSYAYVKIGEGCERNCSYCVIPAIRGRFRSRPPEELLREAEGLISAGKREIILVAQDITSYGRDLGGFSLSRLVRDLASLYGDFWIRLLYLYPTAVSDDLLNAIASEEKVCKYLDMPLQHSEDKIIRLMGRGGSREFFERQISRIRDAVPGIALRTTFIVGFPQETDQDFESMVRFVEASEFDRLGVFTYSREEGTTAFSLKGQVPRRKKEERYRRLMETQSAISLERNRRLLGRTFRAIIDESDDTATVARIATQAPEIDGVVLVPGYRGQKGEFVTVRIDEAYDYDLRGTIVP